MQNQKASEAHVIKMSLNHEDYGAVGARSSTRVIWPTYLQNYLKITEPPIQRIRKNVIVHLRHLDFVQVQSHQIKTISVKLHERCNVNKLTSTESDDNMLHSNKLLSFGLNTRTIETDFVAPRVNEFQKFSQFVLRARNKHIWMLSLTEITYIELPNQISKSRCWPVEWIVHVQAL